MSIDGPAVARLARLQASDELLSAVPDNIGPRLATAAGGVQHVMLPPGVLTFSSPGDFVAVMLAPVPGMQMRFGSDRMRTFDAQVGTLIVDPAGTECEATWSHRLENVTVGFAPGRLAALAEQELGIADLELRPPNLGYVDGKALKVARLIRQELAEGVASELYVDSLMTVLGLHVVRHHSNAVTNAGAAGPAGGLTPAVATRVREYVHEHFAGKIAIATLAGLANLSPGRFIHAFSRTFGIPPHRYVINVRLAHAARLLSETDDAIAEIAYLSGFSSQSHLTATLRKYRGLTPAQVRATRAA